MTRRYLLFIEADSPEDANQTLRALLASARYIEEPSGHVEVGIVDVTDRIVRTPRTDHQAAVAG